MHKIIYYITLLSLLLIAGSCKTTNIKTGTVNSLSIKKILKEYKKQDFSKKTVRAKIKMRYEDARNTQNITIKLRMEKDKVIWMSASFLGYPLAKVKITPTSVQYYEKINKTYFDGDFGLINKTLGVVLDFEQFQNILLGQMVYIPNTRKIKKEIDKQSYLLIPQQPIADFLLFYWINPSFFKLDKQAIRNIYKQESLTITYPEYYKSSHTFFPKKMSIIAKSPKQNIKIEMDIRSIEYNKRLTFPYKTPSGYKQIKIDER